MYRPGCRPAPAWWPPGPRELAERRAVLQEVKERRKPGFELASFGQTGTKHCRPGATIGAASLPVIGAAIAGPGR
jgi:hypothetical protein